MKRLSLTTFFEIFVAIGLLAIPTALFADPPSYTANGGTGSWFADDTVKFALDGPGLSVTGSSGQIGVFGYAAPGSWYVGDLPLIGNDPLGAALGTGTAGGIYYSDLYYWGSAAGIPFTVFVPLGNNVTVTTFAAAQGTLNACTPSFACEFGDGAQVFSVNLNVPGELALYFQNQSGMDALLAAQFTAVPEPSSLALLLGGVSSLIGFPAAFRRGR